MNHHKNAPLTVHSRALLIRRILHEGLLLLALLLAAAAIASAIAAHLQLSGVQIDAISAEPVPAGQPLRLRVDLSLRDPRARHGLHLQLGDSEAWTSLPAHGRGEVELHVPSERRGWLELPRIRLSTTQPLGLVRAWSWVWPEQPLLVYPQPEALAPALPEAATIRCTRAPMPVARNCISYGPIVRAMRHAAFRGSTRHAATACWCASTKSRLASKSSSIGARCPRWAMKHASRVWRDGSTWPSAKAAATPCCCLHTRRSGQARAPATTTCACVHWH